MTDTSLEYREILLGWQFLCEHEITLTPTGLFNFPTHLYKLDHKSTSKAKYVKCDEISDGTSQIQDSQHLNEISSPDVLQRSITENISREKNKIQIQTQIQIKSWRVTRSARRAPRGRRHLPTLLTFPITPPIIFLNHNICISKFWQYVKHRFYPAPKHTLLAEYSFRREILTWRINISVLQVRIWNPIPHYWIYQYIHK